MLKFIVLISCCVVLCVGHKECERNEEMRCVQSCPPHKTCRNRDVQFNCLQVIEPCVNQCVCKPGLLRNAVGDCITTEECDKCQGANEHFECGSACDNECAKLDTQNKTNCPIKNIVCNRKCYCDDGYARDGKGDCIPIEKCRIENQNAEDSSSNVPKGEARLRGHTDTSETTCSGENEVFTDCMKSCPPDTCLSLVARFKCDSSEPCKNGCVCKPDYLRESPDSPCIPICQCSELEHSPDCEPHAIITKD